MVAKRKPSKTGQKANSAASTKSPNRSGGMADQIAIEAGHPHDHESGEPGDGSGRVEYVGPSHHNDIRIDPNIIEGQSGYEESGSSEIIAKERLIETSKQTTHSKAERSR